MIYCTVGVTGSGKTTWTKEFAKKHHCVVINDDTMMEMLHGKYEYVEEEQYWIKMSAVRLAKTLSWNLNQNVIIDSAAWFLSEKDRDECSFLDSEITWVVFNIPSIQVVTERRQKNSRGYPIETWLEVYQTHKNKLEPLISSNTNIIYVD